jgi:hypothetical protein
MEPQLAGEAIALVGRITDALGPDLCASAGPPDIGEVTARLVRDRMPMGEVATGVDGGLLRRRRTAR